MTPSEFKQLPALIKRCQVAATGIDEGAIDELTVELHAVNDRVPFGKLGAVRGLARKRKRKSKGYRLWRRLDVARVLGPEWV